MYIYIHTHFIRQRVRKSTLPIESGEIYHCHRTLASANNATTQAIQHMSRTFSSRRAAYNTCICFNYYLRRPV